MSFIKKIQGKYIIADDLGDIAEIIVTPNKAANTNLLFRKPNNSTEAKTWLANAVKFFNGSYYPDVLGRNYVMRDNTRWFTVKQAELFDVANKAAQKLDEKKLEIQLGADINPDFDVKDQEVIKPFKQKVASIEEAKKVARKFIDDNSVGGGSWYAADAGWIFEDGKKIARIAYNGSIQKA